MNFTILVEGINRSYQTENDNEKNAIRDFHCYVKLQLQKKRTMKQFS